MLSLISLISKVLILLVAISSAQGKNSPKAKSKIIAPKSQLLLSNSRNAIQIKLGGAFDSTIMINAIGGGTVWYDKTSRSWEWSVTPQSDLKEFNVKFYAQGLDTVTTRVGVIDVPSGKSVSSFQQGTAQLGDSLQFDLGNQWIKGKYEADIILDDSIIYSSSGPKFKWIPSSLRLLDTRIRLQVKFTPKDTYDPIYYSVEGSITVDSITLKAAALLLPSLAKWDVTFHTLGQHPNDIIAFASSIPGIVVDSTFAASDLGDIDAVRRILFRNYPFFGNPGCLLVDVNDKSEVIRTIWIGEHSGSIKEAATNIMQLMDSRFGPSNSSSIELTSSHLWLEGGALVHLLRTTSSSIQFITESLSLPD